MQQAESSATAVCSKRLPKNVIVSIWLATSIALTETDFL